MREIGALLREARERKQLTLAQVEEETKIRSKYLAALESGRPEEIPGPVYVKGFLRTYAKYLGLDGNALVERARTLLGDTDATPEQASAGTRAAQGSAGNRSAQTSGASTPAVRSAIAEQTLDASRSRPIRPIRPAGGRSWVSVLVALALLGAVVAAWYFWPRAASPTPTPTPASSTPLATDASPNAPSSTPAAQTPPTQQNPVTPPATTVEVMPGTVAQEQWAITVRGAKSLDVQVKLPHDSWLKVTADGVVQGAAAGATVQKGTDPLYHAQGSMSISIGWTEGLVLVVNGKELPALPSMSRVTVNLTLAP